MGLWVYLPLLAALAHPLLVRWVRPRIEPERGAWAAAATLVVIAGAAVGSLLLLAWPLVARIPVVAALGPWRAGGVGSADGVPTVVSVLALAGLTVVAVRLTRLVAAQAGEHRSLRRIRRRFPVARLDGVVTIADDVPAAYAVPAMVLRPARIVVTTALCELLTADELAAVVEHERAHLQARHHWLSRATAVAGAVNPFHALVADDVALLLERAADEAACRHTGRRTLLRALAKAALATPPVTGAPAPAVLHHARHAIAERAHALAAPAPVVRRRWPLATMAAVAGLATITLAVAVGQTWLAFDHLMLSAAH